MTDLETILSWFQAGDIPTAEEFKQTFSSFRHKNTKIPITEIDGLEDLDYVQKKYVDDAIANIEGGNEGGVWIFPISS